MSVRIIGAGLGRTGTSSLRDALERLLGGRCYHMREVFQHPEHMALWHQAALGDIPGWAGTFDGYCAVLDWPAASFWREISNTFPDAPIVLSLRDPESWWRSASTTIFQAIHRMENPEWRQMIDAVFEARFTLSLDDKDACIAAYERHVADVRAKAPADRLIEWQPGDGWEPLCDALGMPVPDELFPHVNTKREFLAR